MKHVNGYATRCQRHSRVRENRLVHGVCYAVLQYAVHNLGTYAAAEAEAKEEADRIAKLKSQLAGGVKLDSRYSTPVVPWNESRPEYNDTNDEVGPPGPAPPYHIFQHTHIHTRNSLR